MNPRKPSDLAKALTNSAATGALAAASGATPTAVALAAAAPLAADMGTDLYSRAIDAVNGAGRSRVGQAFHRLFSWSQGEDEQAVVSHAVLEQAADPVNRENVQKFVRGVLDMADDDALDPLVALAHYYLLRERRADAVYRAIHAFLVNAEAAEIDEMRQFAARVFALLDERAEEVFDIPRLQLESQATQLKLFATQGDRARHVELGLVGEIGGVVESLERSRLAHVVHHSGHRSLYIDRKDAELLAEVLGVRSGPPRAE